MDAYEAFEKFANYTELLQHQPDAFSSDMELLDTVSIGGGDDGGIDGIAIKINNYLINTLLLHFRMQFLMVVS